MDLGEHYTSFLRQFEAARQHLDRTMVHGGWLHAWQPSKYPDFREVRDYFHYKEYYLYPFLDDQELQAEFAKFAAEALYKADPSADKKYFSVLARWFRYGTGFNELSKIPAVLSRYEALLKDEPDVTSDPYRLYREANHPGMKRRPVKKDPLAAALTFNDLNDFIDLYEARKKRAKSFVSGQCPSDVSADQLIHAGEEFCLYNGYSRGGESIVLELSNGARYYLGTNSGRYGKYFEARDENHRDAMPERMMRDVLGLADALAPIFSETFDLQVEDEYRPGGSPHAVLSFAQALQFANLPSPFDNGFIASAFEKKYVGITERFAEKRGYQDQLRGYDREREQRDNARDFYELYDDLATLVHFPQDRETVSGETISNILGATIEAGAAGSVRRSLHVINNVPIWRDAITAEHITPIFNSLAESVNMRLGYEGERLDESGQKALTKLMTFIATTPYWRNGEEAKHLPLAIDYILRHKDFQSLKVILLCATRPDDEVSQIWRDAIPQELKDRINDNRFDNLFKYHHIDLLMQRLDDLHAGDTRMYRLREMPNTRDAREAHDVGIEAKRRSRAKKAADAVHAIAV